MAKRGHLTKLKNLLLSRNYEEIDLGIQLAHALADPPLFDALTGGTSLGMRGDMQVLVPNGVFGASTLGQWRLYALLGLVAVAPEGSEVFALRPTLTSLRLYAGDGDYRCRTRQSFTYLHAFANLRAINVWSCNLIDCASIEKLSALEVLELRRCGFDGPIRLAPSVRKIEVTRHDWMPHVDVFGDLETWSQVEEIYACRIDVRDGSAFSQLRSVRTLSLPDTRLPETAKVAIEALPKLKKLKLH